MSTEARRAAARRRYAANPEPVKERQRRYAAANAEKRRAYARAYYARNREEVNAKNRARKYGTSVDEMNELLSNQGGKCAICEVVLSPVTAIGIGNATPKIDHCHMTGRIRGVLCGHCNLLLGHAKDNIETIRRAALYLESKTRK